MAFEKRPPKKDFQKETIRILRAVPDGERGTELAVIRWITDGTAYAPQLANTEVYIDRLTKKTMHGKIKGLKWGDWKFLTQSPDMISEIADLLSDSPGRTKRQSGQDAAANDTARDEAKQRSYDEDVPF